VNIGIVGANSFVASSFISYCKINLTNTFKFTLFSRSPITQFEKEISILVDDYTQLSSESFQNLDIVINFTAIVHNPSHKDDKLYHQINHHLAKSLATKAKFAGVSHFIQISTIAVYVENNYITEKTTENPCTLYGLSKLNADNALLAMQDDSFKVSIIRPPMVYGGGRAPGNMQKLIKFALTGIPLPFEGVNNKRDFIHVNNLVQALNLVIEHELYGIVIPTDRNPVSTSKILNLVNKYSKGKIRKIAIPLPILQLIKWVNSSLYKKVYGDLLVECNMPESIYQPKYLLDSGIKEMVKAIENGK